MYNKLGKVRVLSALAALLVCAFCANNLSIIGAEIELEVFEKNRK